jgi:bifunctional UDP-N-acetylglucosamine pyrophosphorylase / glucosamine-1-phosphate N-acetyltransferase
MKNISIIILAAGKGTRMNSDQPKVLTRLNGKSLIENLLKTINKTEYSDSVSIVVGYKGEKVIQKLGDQYNYIWQREQLGTGHAVQQCGNSLKDKFQDHLILYGDVPFISLDTIQNIIKTHQDQKSILTMVTLKLSDFNGIHKTYYHFGRIVRDEQGELLKIVEFKDASEKEKKSTEVNPAIYCVNDHWLWENLEKLKDDNNQSEYYLTDLVTFAHEQGIKVKSVVVKDQFELMGINTKEDIKLAQNIYRDKC